jgi:meso-butanediol dehydrogenase/(S,S)-butanediol dehydrogenase/diacetyl reductase
MLLKDKVIFLTGGSMGIGYECAKAYAAEGALVCIIGKEEDTVSEVIVELGDPHMGIVCNVTRETEVKDAIARTLKFYEKIDAIHNNAGISSPSKSLHETSAEEWDNVFNTNLKSIYFTTRYGMDAIIKTKGSILNTSSLVGEIGQEMHAAYSATKGGVNALTKSMALDYAKFGIRVNAVCPAGVWTPALRNWSKEQLLKEGIGEYLDQIHALGYCPEADVIADACVFLLSEKARFITGCALPVSGGAELGYRKIMQKKETK